MPFARPAGAWEEHFSIKLIIGKHISGGREHDRPSWHLGCYSAAEPLAVSPPVSREPGRTERTPAAGLDLFSALFPLTENVGGNVGKCQKVSRRIATFAAPGGIRNVSPESATSSPGTIGALFRQPTNTP